MKDGFENLVKNIRRTQAWANNQQSWSLVDYIFEKGYGQVLIDTIRLYLMTDLADFVNDYAECLSESMMALTSSGHVEEADIVAAEALSELEGQLRFVRENRHEQPPPTRPGADPKWVLDNLGDIWRDSRSNWA
jgi:hypothetical protein